MESHSSFRKGMEADSLSSDGGIFSRLNVDIRKLLFSRKGDLHASDNYVFMYFR